MTSSEGAFYSSQDADSDGEEGRFFVWVMEEIEEVLGKEDADLFEDVYGVTAEGNWESHNILYRSKTWAQAAALRQIDEPHLRSVIEKAKEKLLRVRSQRTRPPRDDKVLTSWNALMIDSFAQAARVLEQPAYAQTASRAADFILRRLRCTEWSFVEKLERGSHPKDQRLLGRLCVLRE